MFSILNPDLTLDVLVHRGSATRPTLVLHLSFDLLVVRGTGGLVRVAVRGSAGSWFVWRSHDERATPHEQRTSKAHPRFAGQNPTTNPNDKPERPPHRTTKRRAMNLKSAENFGIAGSS
jgi:hypothetical protein